MKNNKGLAPLFIILVFVGVIAVGVGGYVIVKNMPGFGPGSPNSILQTPEQPTQEDGQSQKKVNPSPTQQVVPPPTTESLKSNDFAGCVKSGGRDITPDFNSPQKCILNNKVYESDCVSNDKYFVVQKSLVDSVGADILVKYKSTSDQQYSCEYLVSDSDFRIKNESAEYVFALENNFLILDSGTGPSPRGLIVYDLASRKKVFTDSYSGPIAIRSNTVTYWSPATTKPDETNCPEIAEYTSWGLGAIIEARVVLALPTLNKTNLGEYRCSATQ